jgi:hypothetical protein
MAVERSEGRPFPNICRRCAPMEPGPPPVIYHAFRLPAKMEMRFPNALDGSA